MREANNSSVQPYLLTGIGVSSSADLSQRYGSISGKRSDTSCASSGASYSHKRYRWARGRESRSIVRR